MHRLTEFAGRVTRLAYRKDRGFVAESVPHPFDLRRGSDGGEPPSASKTHSRGALAPRSPSKVEKLK